MWVGSFRDEIADVDQEGVNGIFVIWHRAWTFALSKRSGKAYALSLCGSPPSTDLLRGS